MKQFKNRQIIYLPLDQIKPYYKNARINDGAVEAVANSIRSFGFENPIILDKNKIIIAGHTRLKAAKMLGLTDAPCIIAEDLTDAEAKALRLADNKTAELAEWDLDLLNEELEALNFDFNMEDFGFDLDLGEEEPEELQEVEAPEVDEENEPTVKNGEVWQLGSHLLICGDSTKKETLNKLLGDIKADLVFTDPPYGMKKERQGVLNDNLNYDDLLEFNKQWIPLSFESLKDNGSWYCWGIDEPLMDIYSNILKPMIRENKITFRNLITWFKNPSGCGDGQNNPLARSYGKITEKCLFVMCGVQGFNNNISFYFNGFEPIRKYLEEEAEKVKLTAKVLRSICGCDMFSHWFSKSQWAFITEEHYKELQNHYNGLAFSKPYKVLLKEYNEAKKQQKEQEAYFNNTHDLMTEVWQFDRTSKEERALTGEHATPKPLALCARAIKSSSRVGESVLDLFGGSGSTLITCEQLGRTCYTVELDPRYCDVIIKRWETLTGEKAKLKIN